MNTLKFGNGEWYGKKDTILAYNDENSNFKPLPFSFDRASSATRVNKEGLIETVGSGEPRIDYKDDSKGALLLETSRTNSILYSNGFDNSAWEKGVSGTASAPVVSANQGISPDGTNNAFKIDFNIGGGTTSSDRSRLTENFTNTLTTDYTFSFYAKAYSQSDVGKVVNFSVDNVTNEDFNFTLTSDWQRFTSTGQSNGNNINLHIQLRGNLSTSDTASLLLFGFQAEAGSYATSYIPTQGSAVTRVADSCEQTVPSGVIGQTEGTVYWEIDVQTTVATANENILNIDNGNGFGSTIYLSKSSTGTLVAEMYLFGSLQASLIKTNITKGIHKMAMGYANNNTAFFVDGVQVGVTDTSCTVPLMSRIQLGSGVFGEMIGLSNDLKLYNTRLSNAELQALTT